MIEHGRKHKFTRKAKRRCGEEGRPIDYGESSYVLISGKNEVIVKNSATRRMKVEGGLGETL